MKPLASLSLDLDNLWAYQMTHGDEGWDAYDSYLDALVPTVLEVLADQRLHITFFVVGQDAALDRNEKQIRALAEAGHEIGNHSYRHQPWLHRYTPEEIDDELARAEAALEAVTGQHPIGFRGPGYSLSADVQRAERSYLFGGFREGLRPVKPYEWQVGDDRLLEIPVTTMPLTRIPIHVSYVLYLAGPSPALAQQYFTNALRLCRVTGVEPSILLHPLDFLGADDVDALGFFPGMGMTGARKRAVVRSCLAELNRQFRVLSLRDHAAAIAVRDGLAVKPATAATPVLEASR